MLTAMAIGATGCCDTSQEFAKGHNLLGAAVTNVAAHGFGNSGDLGEDG
jgi:hypothetical protein